MITVRNLTKTFGEHTAVADVSFTLEAHTSTALIGPNGAGKTTVLSMLTGLLAPTSGTIEMKGVKDMRKEIGFLPQYPQFFPWLTALEFTEMTAKLSGISGKEARKEGEKVLAFVGLEEAMHKKIATFSGGMKQRLGIAQAIVHKPKVLLLDEPVSALDPIGRREMMNLLKELQQQTTILYSTHILNDAEEMTDQLLFLRKGILVEQGSLIDIRKKFDAPRYKIDFETEEEALQFVSQSQLHATVTGSSVSIEIIEDAPSMKQLMERLVASTFHVKKVERVTASLEEIFLEVAGR